MIPKVPVRAAPRHLFEAWPQVSRRFRSAEHLLLMLDFDGTLAPITAAPRDARPVRDVRRILGRLARRPRTRVYVISGRPLSYLQKKLNVPKVRLLGLHGWEKPGTVIPAGERRRFLQAKRWLQQRLLDRPGIELEDKGLGLAVHYGRAFPQEVSLAREAVLQILWRSNHTMRLMEGRNIWELLPAFIKGKGATSARLLAQLSRRWLPVYTGDDQSDESAFAALRQGVTIHVGGSEDTQARFWLRDPSEVREFLERLEAMTP